MREPEDRFVFATCTPPGLAQLRPAPSRPPKIVAPHRPTIYLFTQLIYNARKYIRTYNTPAANSGVSHRSNNYASVVMIFVIKGTILQSSSSV